MLNKIMHNNSKEHMKMGMSNHEGIELTGLCTVMHHQYHQVVDLLITTYKCALNGLNPCTLPYAPKNVITEEDKEETYEEKEEKGKMQKYFVLVETNEKEKETRAQNSRK